VAAKLRGEFAVRYWTVVQHQRDARTANASCNIFIVDHDALMKKQSGPALSRRGRTVQVGSRDILGYASRSTCAQRPPNRRRWSKVRCRSARSGRPRCRWDRHSLR